MTLSHYTDGAATFAKRVAAGEIQSPLRKSEWLTTLRNYAEERYSDPAFDALTKEQEFSKRRASPCSPP